MIESIKYFHLNKLQFYITMSYVKLIILFRIKTNEKYQRYFS